MKSIYKPYFQCGQMCLKLCIYDTSAPEIESFLIQCGDLPWGHSTAESEVSQYVSLELNST